MALPYTQTAAATPEKTGIVEIAPTLVSEVPRTLGELQVEPLSVDAKYWTVEAWVVYRMRLDARRW